MKEFENLIKEIEETKNFSGVVSLRKDEEILFQKVEGYADLFNKRENNLETKFGIASGAKGFTSLAICKLIQDGKLSFNSLLKDYIDLPNYDNSITIEQLLTHTSGISDYFDEDIMDDFSEIWKKTPMYTLREPKDFLKILKEGYMKSKPGEKFSYNNSAFVILSLVVEKVSGQAFSKYVKENILDVLDMKNTGYYAMDMLPENCAYGYEEIGENKFKSNIYSIPVVGGGDGGIFTTEEDMNKFWNGLLSYKLLNKKMTKNILTPKIYVNYDVYYGYGIWIIKREDKIYKYYLQGEDPGVTFISSIYPSEKMVFSLLGNKEFGSFGISKVFEEELEK